MQIELKLFATLADHLPPGTQGNITALHLAEGETVQGAMERAGVPLEGVHLVVLNGVYVPPGERSRRVLHGGDTLALWPPVAGG